MPFRLHMAVAALSALILVGAPVRANELLWGDTPMTFGAGVVHPDLMVHWEDDDQFIHGRNVVPLPVELRQSRSMTMLAVQWAPKPSLNIGVEVPYATMRMVMKDQDFAHHGALSGVGDVTVLVKSRVAQRISGVWKTMQAVTGGIKLPTAARGRYMSDEMPVAPSQRPGSRQLGVVLGYAASYNRLQDMAVFSTRYTKDVTGSERMGDQWTMDASYGRWLQRADQPEQLGICLLAGPHWERAGRDRWFGVRDPSTEHTLLGAQATLLVTKGQGTFRIGAMLPFRRNYPGYQMTSRLQVRAGAAMLF